LKEKLFWMGILAIILSGVFNYQIYKSHQLEEPIFLEHYIAKEVYPGNDMVTLTFYFLTNKENPTHVNYVLIDDVFGYTIDNYTGMSFDGQPQFHYHQEFTYYYSVPLTIEIPADTIPVEGEDSWQFSSMDVYFGNGEMQTVDIGEVIISKAQQSKIEPLQFLQGSGGSDGFGETLFTSAMPHEVIRIDHPFEGKVEDQVAIKVSASGNSLPDNESMLPSWLEEGEFESWNSKVGSILPDSFDPISIDQDGWLRIYTQARPNHPTILEFPIDIYGVTDSGDEFHVEAHVNELSYLEEKQIREIIREKRGGGQ
jgi:hypothetical protein